VSAAIAIAAPCLLIVTLAARMRSHLAPARCRRARRWANATRPAISWSAAVVRRSRVSDDDVAAWCDEISRIVRSGASLPTALRSAAPTPALARVLAPIGLALDRGDSVANATQRVVAGSSSVDLALGVLRACAELGGPAAQPLDRTASTLRARAADVAERQVHSAQARLSAIVLTLLPGGALALLLTTSAASRAAITGPTGLFCLSAGVALNATGWWWMRRIIGRSP
jgi:tight adherence protein B